VALTIFEESTKDRDLWSLCCAFWRYGGMPRLLIARLGFGPSKAPEGFEEKIKFMDTKMMKLAHELAKNGTRLNNFFQSDKLPHEIASYRRCQLKYPLCGN
jgi:hypothetical protein